MAVFRGTIRLLSNVVYSLVDQDGFRDTTDNSVDISINSSTGVITFTGVYDTSAFATFRATVTNPDGTTVELDKTLTVSRVQDGQPADPTVIIDLKSESDVVAAQNNGTGYDLTGLDNQIYLYKADTIVSSDDVVFGIQGIPSGTGTTVEKTISGLKFTVTKATGVVVIASTNLDSWTTDQVVITFTATYNGTTYSQQYTLAKSRAGTDSVHVDLKSESDVVASKSDGTGYDLTDIQNEIRLYKGGEKLTNGVTYGPASTTKNGLTVSVNTTTGAFTLSGTNWNTNQEFFIINATYNSKTYSKTYSITKGRQGISATLIQLTNDSHIIQADESGSAYNYDGANTTASIIIGGDDDSNNWTWTAPTIPSGLTASITNSNRTVTITSSTTTFRSGTITFTATRTGYSTQTAVFSITKNNDGANAVIIDLTNDSHNIQANKDGVAYNHTGATTTATVKKGGQDDSNNWTWTAPTIPSGLTATISSDNRTVTITDSATTFRSGTITFTATRTGYATQIAVFSITKTKDGLTGQSATLIQLTNDSHIIQADESGSAYNYDGANTTASIIIGGDDDSNNWTWTAPTIPSGLTASITNSNRTVTITSSTTTFRSGTITFTATRTGYSTQTAVFSITKNNDGANAVIIDLTNDSHNIQANKDGVAYNHTGATTTATVKKGGQDDSNNWTWTAPTIPSGLTATISSDNRTVTITDSATTFRSGTITFTATRTGYATQIAVFSITKTKDGLTGQVIVDSYIFKRSASQPPTPSGGDFANPVPSGWSDGIPADDQYGNPVWFSHRKFTSDGLTPQAAAWSTPQKVLQPSTSIRYVFSETEPPGTAPVDGLPSSGWSFTPTTNTIYVQVQKSVNNGLNWTNEGVPIKIKGETGLKGLNTLIAYAKVGQNQSAPAIQSTTTYPTLPNTSGSTVWQSTAPTATVGEVIWYSYGKYNPNSSGTIDGVAAGQIVWSTPIAASVFQDIRSDNWQASTGFNGSTPTGGIFTSATGYYLNKTEGSLYATNVFLRGTASFDSFQTKGETSALLTTTTRTINNQSYNKIATTAASTYSFGSTITNAGQYIRSAQFLETNKDTGCIFNVGLLISALGSAGLSTGQDVGIISTSSFFGGFFETTSNLGAGLIAKTTFSGSPGNGNKDNGGYALWVEGNIRWGSVVWETPPNDTSKFLCSNGTWGAPSVGNTITGNLYVSGDIFAFTSSDIGLKRNLSTIKNPLEKLQGIRGYSFDWSKEYLANLPENFIKSKDIGLIAQEVEKYIPEAVVTRDSGIKAVNYQKLIPLIIEAIIELNNKLNKDK